MEREKVRDSASECFVLVVISSQMNEDSLAEICLKELKTTIVQSYQGVIFMII